jgi:hypothetical protein
MHINKCYDSRGAHRRTGEISIKFWSENLMRRDHLENKGPMVGPCEYGNKHAAFIKCGRFIE